MSEDGGSSTGATLPVLIPVETVLYYYGNISRETAEWILWDRGCQDGMYLLRESNGDYVLSLCFQKSVLHYRIKKLPTGDVGLFGVPHQLFPGPVELVEGVEGLACKPTIPCNKSLDAILPLTHWGLSDDEIRQAVMKKGQEWGLNEAELMLSMSEDRNDVKHLIIKTLHQIQPWFHGTLSRTEAERNLLDSGHKDGKFLVRERDESSYAFCLSHSGRIKHYKIDVLPSGEFAIQDGQRFPSIMALVSHYSLFSDGLWCALTEPCIKNEPSNRQDRPPLPTPPVVVPDTQSVSPPVLPIPRTSPISIQSESSRAKVVNGRHSPGILNSPSWHPKGSKANSSSAQKGLFTKLVQSVAPSMHSESSSHPATAVTSPQLMSSPARLTDKSGRNASIVPAQSNNTPSTGGNNTTAMPPPTPPHNRKPSGSFAPPNEEHIRKSSRSMQKASSFDLIPAFFSALFSPGEGGEIERKSRGGGVKRGSDAGLRKGSISSDYRQVECNGHHHKSEFYVSTDNHRIASPNLCHNKKGGVELIHYANKDILSVGGRSASLGETRETGGDNKEGGALSHETLTSIDGQSPTFIRSASSPSVVSQGTKLKPPLPPRPPHMSITSSECFDEPPKPKLIIAEDDKLHSSTPVVDGPPVPPPRRKAVRRTDKQHHHEDYRLINGGNDSPDRSSTTSPTLTEDSMSVPGSPLHESSENLLVEAITDDVQLISFESPPPPPPEHSCSDAQSFSSQCTSPDFFVENSLLMRDVVEKPDSTYATLSGDSRLLFTDEAGVLDEPQLENGEIKHEFSREESELAYQTLRRCRRGPVSLDPKAIILKDKIGSGNFGEVLCGCFSSGSLEVQFAVKMLKSSVAHQKTEILEEAQTMAALDHPHIVRLIGVCEGDPFMLVMELAPLGPLNKHLKNHKEMSVESITMLLVQVAWAMEYLESQQYVHRDLAARNVLLVNESFAKISDFGMSRALGLGKEYYRAETAGKWPLKWYAPECIYYFKFSTKSDVWSFGVTMWEALSYGQKPYQGMAGRDILQMFDRNERLPKPEGCPNDVYDIMRKCWNYKPEERPDFCEVHHCLKQSLPKDS